LLAPRPTPKLEGQPLSAVRDWLFIIFASTLRVWRSSLHPHPDDAPYRGGKGLASSNSIFLLPSIHKP
jgi:hypothetical protein